MSEHTNFYFRFEFATAIAMLQHYDEIDEWHG